MGRQLKSRLLLAGLIVIILAAAGLGWYFGFHIKTPDYAVQQIQTALNKHDKDTFYEYVNLDAIMDSSYDGFMEGVMESSQPVSEEARQAASSLTSMMKAPLCSTFKAAVDFYIENGEWNTGRSGGEMASDARQIIEKSGLENTEFRGITGMTEDKDMGIATANVLVYQSEADGEFTLAVRFVKTDKGIWRATEVVNFKEFIAFIAKSQREHLAAYMEATKEIMNQHDRLDKSIDASIHAVLMAGKLGDDSTRQAAKKILEDELVAEWESRKADLEAVEVPAAARSLQRLRLRICELHIEYAKNYAQWMDDKKVSSLRAAEANQRQVKILEDEADILSKRISN